MRLPSLAPPGAYPCFEIVFHMRVWPVVIISIIARPIAVSFAYHLNLKTQLPFAFRFHASPDFYASVDLGVFEKRWLHTSPSLPLYLQEPSFIRTSGNPEPNGEQNYLIYRFQWHTELILFGRNEQGDNDVNVSPSSMLYRTPACACCHVCLMHPDRGF